MPHYTFEHRETGEQINEVLTIAARDKFLADNPEYFQVIMPIGRRDNFVSSRHTNIPIDGDFKSMLSNMKKANPGSTIDW